MLTDDFKTITYLDASFQSSVMASTRYLGCRVQHASNGSSHIALMPTGVVLTTATETWHVVAELDLRANVYQALCQNNRITVRLPNGRIAHWVADKLECIHTHDLMIALACFIEQGYEHLDAMTLALAWLTQQACAAGAAWPQERRWFPRTRFANDHKMAENAEFSPIRIALFTLYPVVDTVEWLALVLKQGVTTAQLRIKDPNDPELTHKIQQAIALGEQHGAQVFINDYWQLAIELGAYGVHLGQEDIEVADLSAIQAAGLRLGISTHGYFEIMRAFNLKPSYIALGHIFPTVTKDMPSQPQGLTRLGQYVALINGAYPTVAIGGINAERLPQVKATGVDSIALVTAITRSAEPELATRTLLAAVTETGDSHATVCE